MKKTKVFVGLLLGTALLVLFLGLGWAKTEPAGGPVKVGVVSVEKILEKSRRHADWQKTMGEEEKKIRAELEKMNKDVEAIKADMDTRQAGSNDYLNLMRDYMGKRATLEAMDKYYEQQMTTKVQQWTEQLYQDILSASGKVAKDKGLDLIMAKEEVKLPAPSVRDMMLTIKTNKVLYAADGLDITEDVLAVVDAVK